MTKYKNVLICGPDHNGAFGTEGIAAFENAASHENSDCIVIKNLNQLRDLDGKIDEHTRIDILAHGSIDTDSEHALTFNKGFNSTTIEKTKDILNLINSYAHSKPVNIHLHSCYAGKASDEAKVLNDGSLLVAYGEEEFSTTGKFTENYAKYILRNKNGESDALVYGLDYAFRNDAVFAAVKDHQVVKEKISTDLTAFSASESVDYMVTRVLKSLLKKLHVEAPEIIGTRILEELEKGATVKSFLDDKDEKFIENGHSILDKADGEYKKHIQENLFTSRIQNLIKEAFTRQFYREFEEHLNEHSFLKLSKPDISFLQNDCGIDIADLFLDPSLYRDNHTIQEVQRLYQYFLEKNMDQSSILQKADSEFRAATTMVDYKKHLMVEKLFLKQNIWPSNKVILNSDWENFSSFAYKDQLMSAKKILELLYKEDNRNDYQKLLAEVHNIEPILSKSLVESINKGIQSDTTLSREQKDNMLAITNILIFKSLNSYEKFDYLQEHKIDSVEKLTELFSQEEIDDIKKRHGKLTASPEELAKKLVCRDLIQNSSSFDNNLIDTIYDTKPELCEALIETLKSYITLQPCKVKCQFYQKDDYQKLFEYSIKKMYIGSTEDTTNKVIRDTQVLLDNIQFFTDNNKKTEILNNKLHHPTDFLVKKYRDQKTSSQEKEQIKEFFNSYNIDNKLLEKSNIVLHIIKHIIKFFNYSARYNPTYSKKAKIEQQLQKSAMKKSFHK